MTDWDYRIRGFAPTNRGGYLLLETVHRGEASRDAEIAAWQARLQRGEAGHVIVINLRTGDKETIYARARTAP